MEVSEEDLVGDLEADSATEVLEEDLENETKKEEGRRRSNYYYSPP